MLRIKTPGLCLLALGTVAILGLAACQKEAPLREMAVVVDLARVAVETGHGGKINEAMQSYQEELRTKLMEMEGNMQDRLQEQQASLGAQPSQAQAQEFQQLVADAQRRMQLAGNEAQKAVQERQQELKKSFMETVRPVAARIASARGATMVLVRGDHVLDYDAKLDITEDVISAMVAEAAAEKEALPAQEAPAGQETPAQEGANVEATPTP